MLAVYLLILRFFHIVASVCWAGGGFVMFLFVEPTAKALAPTGMQFLQHMVTKRRFSIFMVVSSTLTVLSGRCLSGSTEMVAGLNTYKPALVWDSRWAQSSGLQSISWACSASTHGQSSYRSSAKKSRQPAARLRPSKERSYTGSIGRWQPTT